MVSVWATSATADSITLNDGRVIDLSIIPGNGWPQPKLDKARDLLQGMIDRRIPLDSDFFKENGVTVDPDALVDPAREAFFHDNGDLVSRSDIIVAVNWDGVSLSLHIRRAK